MAAGKGLYQVRIASRDQRKKKTNMGKYVPFCSTTSSLLWAENTALTSILLVKHFYLRYDGFDLLDQII